MNLPDELSQALESLLATMPRPTLAAAAEDLSRRYRAADREKYSHFMTSEAHRLAYLAVRMPATYAAIKAVLSETSKRLPNFSPTSFCDLGAGPGTASWVASDMFVSLSKMHLYEKDSDWLKIGQNLMQTASHIGLREASWLSMDLSQPAEIATSDLIIASYVIGELPPEKGLTLIEQAWKATQKVLVIIEPGTPHGFERIRQAREHLLAGGAYMVAPCPHAEVCPMANGDWCHFAQRLERNAAHMAAKKVDMGYEDEKFSYLVVAKHPCPLPDARILRYPQQHSGHVEFFLCTPQGLERRTLSRRHGEVFKKSKKLSWGDAMSKAEG